MRFKPLDPPKGGFFYAVVDKICFKFFLPLYFFSSVGEVMKKVFYLIILVSSLFYLSCKSKVEKTSFILDNSSFDHFCSISDNFIRTSD